MSDEISSFDELDTSQLSVEDMAVLQAFEDMDTWPTEQSPSVPHGQDTMTEVLSVISLSENEEMLSIFAAEADDDISSLRQALDQLAESEPGNLDLFLTLKRVGHKLHGTSGAVGFSLISTIAAQVELLAEEVSRGTLSCHVGVLAISAATTALEACLETIVSTHQEPEAVSLLASLKTAYQKLHVDLQQLEEKRAIADLADSSNERPLQSISEIRSQSEQVVQEQATEELSTGEEETLAAHISSEDLQSEAPSICSIPFVRVDAQRLRDLTVSVEKLVEQRAPVEDAQTQVEHALKALYDAQTRLQSLEPLIAKLQRGVSIASSLLERMPASSLVARILHEAPLYSQRQQRQSYSSSSHAAPFSVLKHVNANRSPMSSEEWDELEIEQYDERDMLEHTLKDTLADLAIATTSAQAAFTRFSIIQQDYLASITQVYRDTLLLRQAAFASMVPRLEQVVRMSALGRAQNIRFEVTGAEIEIDQDILDTLATPLVRLLRTCLVDPLVFEKVARSDEKEASLSPHVWLKVINHGNQLTFEIGFSMAIQGGAIEVIRQPVQQLRGTLSLEYNAAGGISFFLRVPHPHSSVVCLLVQVGDQQLLIPFNQIQRIGDGQQEQTDIRYSLQELLGFSGAEPQEAMTGLESSRYLPLLILGSEEGTMGEESIGIVVDKILEEQEYIIKPLPAYLRRPGIAGTTIDGKGHVLLMVDLLTLIRSASQYASSYQTKNNPLARSDRVKILVTDDSVALRHTLIQTLQQASYSVFEAHDGIDALEKLQRYKPDVCLLDIEMPNLNGYGVLQMMSANPSISDIKVIMLTSRRATKYMQYALDLGARAYLTKPCTPDDLFQTIECVLKE